MIGGHTYVDNGDRYDGLQVSVTQFAQSTKQQSMYIQCNNKVLSSTYDICIQVTKLMYI